MNTFRNLHYQVNNNLKKLYKQQVSPQLEWALEPPLEITYSYYHPTKRKADVSNMCCIHDKYFCDALVELGLIEDDDYDNIKQVTYKYWGYDKWNGRIEIEIEKFNKK